MITRFQGKDGRRRLIDTLRRQQIVCGDETIATVIADVGEILEYANAETLIHDGGTDSDLYRNDLSVSECCRESKVSGRFWRDMSGRNIFC